MRVQNQAPIRQEGDQCLLPIRQPSESEPGFALSTQAELGFDSVAHDSVAWIRALIDDQGLQEEL